MELRELCTWNIQRKIWKEGRLVDREELLSLMASGVQPPKECLDFVAAAFRGEVRYKRGANRSLSADRQLDAIRYMAFLENKYSRERSVSKLIGELTAKEKAKLEVSELYGISPRTMDSIMSSENYDLVLSNHQEHIQMAHFLAMKDFYSTAVLTLEYCEKQRNFRASISVLSISLVRVYFQIQKVWGVDSPKTKELLVSCLL